MENTIAEIRSSFERGVFKNEEQIRVCVVCRLLQELGWNIWNPDEVCLEFVVAPNEDQTKVDVALKSSPQRPDVFIEIKAHGQIRNRLIEIERQLRDYNRNNTATFSIITDGAEWRFYYSQTGGEFSQKLFKNVNLTRESAQDVASNLGVLLKKSEIQNGNAERQAVAYLRLTRRQRFMEDLLPEARRRAMEPPFPSLPGALAELLKEQSLEVSIDETAAFISEFQTKSPIQLPVSQPTNILPQALPPITRPRTPKNGIRQLDPHNPGDLRFTRIIEGRIGNETGDRWTELLKSGLRIAQARGRTFEDLRANLSLNMRTAPYNQDGFRWHAELRLSLQGVDADKAANNLYRLARLLNEELYVRFYWREDDGAAHPGEEGIIHWKP